VTSATPLAPTTWTTRWGAGGNSKPRERPSCHTCQHPPLPPTAHQPAVAQPLPCLLPTPTAPHNRHNRHTPLLQGTLNLISAAKRAKVKKFVLVTSIGADDPYNFLNLFWGVGGALTMVLVCCMLESRSAPADLWDSGVVTAQARVHAATWSVGCCRLQYQPCVHLLHVHASQHRGLASGAIGCWLLPVNVSNSML
jgi:hypothetical protein